MDGQKETKGLCFKTKCIYSAKLAIRMFYFGWGVGHNDLYLEVCRFRKTQIFLNTQMSPADKLARSQTAVLACEGDTGQRRGKKGSQS